MKLYSNLEKTFAETSISPVCFFSLYFSNRKVENPCLTPHMKTLFSVGLE